MGFARVLRQVVAMGENDLRGNVADVALHCFFFARNEFLYEHAI
jgi:hypothetical protein